MAKRISQLNQITAGQLAAGDLIPVVDVSAGQTKYSTLSDLTGLPDVGWTATGETWSYSSFSSTTGIGVITVPSDATTKYTVGMRVRISQSTGGTKYGVIVAVTSTTLSVYFNGSTLNNETVSTPVYSPLRSPYGYSSQETGIGSDGLLKMNRIIVKQVSTTTYRDNQVLCAGWGFIQASGSSQTISTFTLPITYDDLPIVTQGHLGYRLNSDPTAMSDFSLDDATILHTRPASGSTLGVQFIHMNGSNVASNTRLGFSFMALGTKA